MSRPDTFGEFVATLADHLDDPDVRGERLAALAHLSRFHHDRLVSATAGEPPARFRRRVLLERAAHRLLTTDAGVLEVALEAGFASHEGFTRAFRAAYGLPPTTWRRSPTQIRLDAPSGVHFHPPGGLRLPSHEETTMDLASDMVDHHVRLLGGMLERAGRCDDSELDVAVGGPVPGIDDDPTLRSVLSRLVGQLGMWNAALDDKAYDWSVEEHETVDSMRRRLAVEGPAFASRVRTASAEGRLDETFVDATCRPARVFTVGGMVAHVLTFAAHRRVVALGALARAGVGDLEWGDPMTRVGDRS